MLNPHRPKVITADQTRVRKRRRNAIHPNRRILRHQHRHKTAHETDHTVLGRGVVDVAETLEAGGGGCEDDTAACGCTLLLLLAHVVHADVGRVDDGFQVDIIRQAGGLEELACCFVEAGGEIVCSEAADAGIGKDVVYLAMKLDGFLEEGEKRGPGGDVGFQER